MNNRSIFSLDEKRKIRECFLALGETDGIVTLDSPRRRGWVSLIDDPLVIAKRELAGILSGLGYVGLVRLTDANGKQIEVECREREDGGRPR